MRRGAFRKDTELAPRSKKGQKPLEAATQRVFLSTFYRPREALGRLKVCVSACCNTCCHVLPCALSCPVLPCLALSSYTTCNIEMSTVQYQSPGPPNLGNSQKGSTGLMETAHRWQKLISAPCFLSTSVVLDTSGEEFLQALRPHL